MMTDPLTAQQKAAYDTVIRLALEDEPDGPFRAAIAQLGGGTLGKFNQALSMASPEGDLLNGPTVAASATVRNLRAAANRVRSKSPSAAALLDRTAARLLAKEAPPKGLEGEELEELERGMRGSWGCLTGDEFAAYVARTRSF